MSRRIITSLCLIYKPYPQFFIIPFIISTPSRQLSMGVGFSSASAGTPLGDRILAANSLGELITGEDMSPGSRSGLV